ncbi:MAG: S8 family peptidase [Planctomycetota bacterium]
MDWRGPFAIRPSSPRARSSALRRAPRPLAGPERLDPRQLLTGDLVASASVIPNDPSFAVEWGLANSGQYAGTPGNDIGAAGAWQFTTGSRSVVVAVIDSGIDLTHPDLAANLWVNPGEIAGDGIDNDGNGFVDDIHGWDFVDNDAVPQDGFGHGTHVAGIIGAVGNNGVGVTGVNWQVSIMVLRIQDDRGAGSTSAMLGALRYATMMRRDHGIMIVASNNSWDAPAGYSGVVEQAIREHGEAGITFVAAAGNNATNTDVTPTYPGGYDLPNVITVASLTPLGGLAASSNYGALRVDVAAPGTVIQSTYKNGGYALLSGTSMAAPHVTGVVALLATAKPGITVAEIRTAILGTATPLESLAGKVATGRLNAFAALGSLGVAPQTPPPPTAPIVVLPVTVTPPIVAATDVSLRVLADVRHGGSVGLYARHDPESGARVMAELFRTAGRFRARIMVHDGSSWRVVAARWVAGGYGWLRFDVIGGSVRMTFQGRLVLAARPATLLAAGGSGLQVSGVHARASNFAVTPRV